jgi:hypothetical protein
MTEIFAFDQRVLAALFQTKLTSLKVHDWHGKTL